MDFETCSSVHKVTFSFEHHKQLLERSSSDLFQAMRTMSWHARSTSLASDEGLKDLTTQSFKTKFQLFTVSWLQSTKNAFLVFSFICSLLYLSEVTDRRIKWPIAFCAFFVTFVVSSAYHMYFKSTAVLIKAVNDLTRAFEKDVTNLL